MQNINLMQVGTVVVLIGMILVIICAFRSAKSGSSAAGETKVAVGGFIGPIPFGFANDKVLMYFLIGLMTLAIIIWFILMHYK